MEHKFMNVGGIRIFYRQTGRGPLLVLLHPSPRSSALMEPLARLLSDDFTVVCPDTPGYGQSQPLLQEPASLYDYVPVLHDFISSFTDQPVLLYGTATGAQLSIAYALTNPACIRHLYLDNAAHFTDIQAAAIAARYFPDLSPQTDGSHLTILWKMVCDSCLYFPWYENDEHHRISHTLPSAEVLQQIMNDYLAAGTGYAAAYKAAFAHERAAKVQQLQCPTTVFKWLGSPLLRYIEALLAHEMPPHITAVETPVAMAERYGLMKKTLLTHPFP